jgi:hypothetical protein
MLPQQKRAWFTLAVVAATCICFAALAILVSPPTGLVSMAFLALLALRPRLFRTKAPGETIELDERDAAFARRSATIGFAISYVSFIFACMIPWAVQYLARGQAEISVHLLIVPVLVAGITALAGSAIALLILYGREEGGDDDAAD